MKKEFKITEHEADLLERIAAATKMDDWFYITEDLKAMDAEGNVNTPEEAVCMLEDGLGYDVREPQSGGLNEEEAKEAEAVFHRARYARCDWRKFSALVFIEGAANQLPTYTIEGIFEEGVYIDLESAPSDFVMMRITHHSGEPCFPSMLTSDPKQGYINYFGTAMLVKWQMPAAIADAIMAGKRLMVSYDHDEEVDDGVGPGGHLFPVWSAA